MTELREELKAEIGTLLPQQFHAKWERMTFVEGTFSGYLLDCITDVVRRRMGVARARE